MKKFLFYTQAIKKIKYKHFIMPCCSNDSFLGRILKNILSLSVNEFVEDFSIVFSALLTLGPRLGNTEK